MNFSDIYVDIYIPTLNQSGIRDGARYFLNFLLKQQFWLYHFYNLIKKSWSNWHFRTFLRYFIFSPLPKFQKAPYVKVFNSVNSIRVKLNQSHVFVKFGYICSTNRGDWSNVLTFWSNDQRFKVLSLLLNCKSLIKVISTWNLHQWHIYLTKENDTWLDQHFDVSQRLICRSSL